MHWIVALFGEKVIPFQVGDLISNRTSRGHAQLKPKEVTLKVPKEYVSTSQKALRPR